MVLCQLGRAAEKDSYASLRSTGFASTYDKSTPPLIDLSRLASEIFLTSPQREFLTKVSNRIRTALSLGRPFDFAAQDMLSDFARDCE
jgi:hypothetical protein